MVATSMNFRYRRVNPVTSQFLEAPRLISARPETNSDPSRPQSVPVPPPPGPYPRHSVRPGPPACRPGEPLPKHHPAGVRARITAVPAGVRNSDRCSVMRTPLTTDHPAAVCSPPALSPCPPCPSLRHPAVRPRTCPSP